jgi:general secretion pathway protein D
LIRVWLTAAILATTLATAGLCASRGDTADSPKELAMALAKKAKRAQKAGHNAEAYLLYSQAAAIDPKTRSYHARMEVLQTRATAESKPQPLPGSESELPPADLSPDDVFDSLTEKEMASARPLNQVPSLKAKPGKLDFDLSGDPRVLFDKVAQAFGLDTVYDGDFPRTGPAIRFHVSGADYRDALHDLEAATGAFVIPLSSRLFMVAHDTPAKRNDLEQSMAIGVPIPQVLTTQEITEIAQVIRQTTAVEKIAWDSADSMIVMRDRVSRVMPAVGVLQQLIAYRPQVMIDLEFLQVDLSDMNSYGFNVTNTFSLTYLGQILNNVITPPSGVTNLLTFGNGKTLIGLSVAQVQAMFNQTLTKSNSLYRTQLRSVAGQPATLHVGEKYPVITSGYFGSTTASSGTVYQPPPTFTFQDLGIDLKVTPYVHGMDDATLVIETSFQVLSGSAVNGIPIIGSRNLKSTVGVRDDEWAVIGSILSNSKSKAVSGFWGLAQIPYLGQLFKQTSTDTEDSDVLIGVRTHLLTLPPGQVVTKRLRVGSDARPFNPL